MSRKSTIHMLPRAGRDKQASPRGLHQPADYPALKRTGGQYGFQQRRAALGKKLNVVGKRLQESRQVAEGLMANLGEDGEGKPAALKHGDAARGALAHAGGQRWQAR